MLVFWNFLCLLLFTVATSQSEKSESKPEKEIESNKTNILRDSKGIYCKVNAISSMNKNYELRFLFVGLI